MSSSNKKNLEKGYVDFPYPYRIIIVEDGGFMIMDLESIWQKSDVSNIFMVFKVE